MLLACQVSVKTLEVLVFVVRDQCETTRRQPNMLAISHKVFIRPEKLRVTHYCEDSHLLFTDYDNTTVG
jgi:hypothetical protein